MKRRRVRYQGYTIVEAGPAMSALGFRWLVDMSQVAGRDDESTWPAFYQLPAAKAFIREELLDEALAEESHDAGNQ